ncbi:OstA-like protein [Mesohalobacter halotolerans]|uniref:OstA-like protein n=1 Tax=Mesohalobacter halotolerans TaxID=1883405 RepID=UPI001FEC13AB|nr:OstA-like protein [Mesohalobacter halotolerans]
MYKFFFLIFLLSFGFAYSQNSQIEYESERTNINEKLYPGAFIFNKVNKQVFFKHEGIKVWCDKAIFYQSENFFKAYGNVKMIQDDTINMRSAYAEYNGKTQFAFASENVVLTTPSNRLTTDSLFFDRVVQKAFYRSGGTVKDTASTITSIRGTYELKNDKYAFRQNVKVTSPDYIINTNILDFYTNNGYAYLYGPSVATTDSGKVYCERGFFNTREDFGYFVKNSKVDYEQRTLYGDSIFFDQKRNFASATNHIEIIDTINRTRVKGHYAEVYKDKDSVIITKNPIASTYQENDSIHIASDTMMITGVPDKRIVRAYPDARLFKSDLSGKADSIHSSQVTGYTKLITKPILWSANSQVNGDTIILISNMETEKLYSLKVFNNSFMVQKDSIEGFNQIKGKKLNGLFENNELTEAHFIKNAETIYYSRNEDNELIGIDKTVASSIKIEFQNREVADMYYYDNVSGNTYPEKELPPNARTFRGMEWRGEEKIKSKADLLTDRPQYELPIIKGLKDIDENDSVVKPFYLQKDLNKQSKLKNIDTITKPNQPKKPKALKQKLKKLPNKIDE